MLRLAQDNLDYYDKILKISRDRFQAGDIARIDLDRLELQRLQYESDLQTALVNLRTTKINLLALLDDRRPVDSFDVDGPFDFSEDILALDDYRKDALDTRPDLRAAVLSVKQAETNYKLAESNGSTDPTIGVWYTHNGSYNNPDALNTLGASVSIPLRIFDRNQGEKLRTKIDIKRNEKLREGVETQVYSDVDSAYATLNSNIEPAQALQAPVSGAGGPRARHNFVLLPARRGVVVGFLECGKRLPHGAIELRESDRVLSDGGAQLNLAVGREVIQ